MNSVSDAILGPAAERPWRLLFVDDEPNIRSSLRRLFRQPGYEVHVAEGGQEGLDLMQHTEIDLVISDMRMPSMDGAQFLEQVHERWPETIRILLTGYADMASTIAAINKGQIYRYITKPWDDHDIQLIVRHALERKSLEREKERLEALTAAQNEELKTVNASLEIKVADRTAELQRANDKLKASFVTTVKVFSNLIEQAEGERAGHSRRVADLARRIAVAMKLDAAAVQDVMLAGLLHDIGKIGMPDALLAKAQSQMNQEDIQLFAKHPVRGAASLMALDFLKSATQLIRSHHERYDGRGFPDRLKGSAIPMGARILAIANDYDAQQIGSMSLKRMTPVEARQFIEQGRSQRYDPEVLDAFLPLVGGEVSSRPQFERALSPADLKPGMVLSRDMISREGALLLSADFVLEEHLVRQIQELADEEDGRLRIYIRTDKQF